MKKVSVKARVSKTQMATIGLSAARIKNILKRFSVRTPSGETEIISADTAEVMPDRTLRFKRDETVVAMYAAWTCWREV